jgi:hypothetical protein
MGSDPYDYSDQTKKNIDKSWLADEKEVTADLAGIATYASKMLTIRLNAANHLATLLTGLNSIPSKAWDKVPLGEGSYAMQQMIGNAKEFAEFVKIWMESAENVGGAATTINNLYGGADGWSAANLDAIKFAWGDLNSPAASLWPPGDPPKTYAQSDKAKQNANRDPLGGQNFWKQHGDAVTLPNGTVIITSWNQYDKGDPRHREMTVTIVTYPGGQKMTTVAGPDGTIHTLEEPGPNGTTTTTMDAKYQSRGKQVVTTATVNGVTTTTTAQYDVEGDDHHFVLSSAVVWQSSAAGQTITTETFDDAGQPTVTGVTYLGAPTPGAEAGYNKVYLDAIKQAKDGATPYPGTNPDKMQI